MLSDYCLWDYGFDYYAPQSFEDRGRQEDPDRLDGNAGL